MSVNVYRDGQLESLTTYPIATTSIPGGVKPDGTSVTIDADGTIHTGEATTPIATTATAGKVKPDGSTISVTQDGTISTNDFVGTQAELDEVLESLPNGTTIYITDDNAEDGGVPIATPLTAGKVRPDGTNISIDATGLLYLDPNEFKLDRKKLFPDDLYPASSITEGIEVAMSVNPGNSQTADIYNFTKPGLYIVSACGNIETANSIQLYYSLLLYDSSAKTIARRKLSNIASSAGTWSHGMNITGIVLAKDGDKLQLKFDNLSSSIQAATMGSCDIQIARIYGFDTPTVSDKWWQQ